MHAELVAVKGLDRQLHAKGACFTGPLQLGLQRLRCSPRLAGAGSEVERVVRHATSRSKGMGQHAGASALSPSPRNRPLELAPDDYGDSYPLRALASACRLLPSTITNAAKAQIIRTVPSTERSRDPSQESI
jgi:hypothetical protein